MDDFLKTFRALNEAAKRWEEDRQSKAKQAEISARSGDNVQFYDGTNMSKNYGNVLSDAVKFYQTEFGMTPRVNIINSPEELSSDDDFYVAGATTTLPDKTGQYIVDLRHLTKEDESEAEKSAKIGETTGYHPKNSGDIKNVPIHELGHVLFGTLFPENDTSSNRQGEYYEGKFYPTLADDIYFSALEDIGVGGNDTKKATEKTTEISGYANSNPAEAVAESLVDYYYNRNDAAPLSKAIVDRLKAKSHRYSMDQQGAFDLSPNANNFVKNLRRYRVIQ